MDLVGNSFSHISDRPGVGVTKTPFVNFSVTKFFLLISLLRKILIYHNSWLDIINHVHIWQVSPQLSCGDNCQI